MDLQVFFNNPSLKKKRKEKPMRSIRKRKKNPVSAVYRKQGSGARRLTLDERLAKGLPVGATKEIHARGPSLVVGKVKVFTDKETQKAFSTLDKSVKALAGAKNVKGVDQKLKQAEKIKEKLKKTIKSRIEKLKKEEARMKDKGYVRALDMSERDARRALKKESADVKRAEQKLREFNAKLEKEMRKVKSVKLPGSKRRKKAAKKVGKKVSRRKVSKKKKVVASKKRKAAKKVSPKKSSKKAKVSPKKKTRKSSKRKGSKASRKRRVKRKSNPIIASNPVVEILDNPKKKKSKKASKKKSSKKSSKRKGKKKSSKKSSKKAAVIEAVEAKPSKKKGKKRKSSKKKKIKASSSHPSKKGSKKSYKKKKHKVKSNPSFGGAMKKIEQISQDYLGHDLAEAGGLLAGGAAIQGVNHAINTYVPQVKEYAAKIPGVGPILAKNMDAILPFALAVAAHHFAKNPHLKSAAKGVIGASVVNMGTSLYLAASKMVGSSAPLSGIIAVPSMSGIIAVPQMGAYHSSDFGAPEGITDADFGGYVSSPAMQGSYIQDADFDSAGPIATAPRRPDQLGSFDVEFSDGEEENLDF